jgi:hypothetical protein
MAVPFVFRLGHDLSTSLAKGAEERHPASPKRRHLGQRRLARKGGQRRGLSGVARKLRRVGLDPGRAQRASQENLDQ